MSAPRKVEIPVSVGLPERAENEGRIPAEHPLDGRMAKPASDVERAWVMEAARRLARIRDGKSQPSPWEEARIRIFARDER